MSVVKNAMEGDRYKNDDVFSYDVSIRDIVLLSHHLIAKDMYSGALQTNIFQIIVKCNHSSSAKH